MKNPNRKADVRRAADGIANRADTLVVVASHGGSALQYAKWISDILETDMVPANRKYLGYTSLYKNIIYIGCVKEGRIDTLGLLQQNYANFNLDGKHIITVAVGLGDPTNTYLSKLMEYNSLCNFGESFYFLPGRSSLEKRKAGEMVKLDRCMKELPKLYGKEDADVIGLRLAKGYDGVDREKIQPIIDEILAVRDNRYQTGASALDGSECDALETENEEV